MAVAGLNSLTLSRDRSIRALFFVAFVVAGWSTFLFDGVDGVDVFTLSMCGLYRSANSDSATINSAALVGIFLFWGFLFFLVDDDFFVVL